MNRQEDAAGAHAEADEAGVFETVGRGLIKESI
jgi:hypothetical protein